MILSLRKRLQKIRFGQVNAAGQSTVLTDNNGPYSVYGAATLTRGQIAIASGAAIVAQLPCQTLGAAAPTVNDDRSHGYYAGSTAMGTDYSQWRCNNDAAGAATWDRLGGTGGGILGIKSIDTIGHQIVDTPGNTLPHAIVFGGVTLSAAVIVPLNGELLVHLFVPKCYANPSNSALICSVTDGTNRWIGNELYGGRYAAVADTFRLAGLTPGATVTITAEYIAYTSGTTVYMGDADATFAAYGPCLAVLEIWPT